MKPPWFKIKIPSGKNYQHLKKLFSELKLHTVCEEAQCPNIGDCWQRQSATIMIMGDICTRSCGFCAVKTGRPKALDVAEPANVARALSQLNLSHVVITSVDRDDLADGGAAHFAETIRQVKALCPQTRLEVLIGDFKGNHEDVMKVLKAGPDILNHNLETVASLQKKVRPQASYDRSLQVLRWAWEAGQVVKSGIMLGLGETPSEIRMTLQDLRERGKVSILTIGQYLRPTPQHLSIQRYYTPQEFAEWQNYAESLGFEFVASGPLVRSSYHADEAVASVF